MNLPKINGRLKAAIYRALIPLLVYAAVTALYYFVTMGIITAIMLFLLTAFITLIIMVIGVVTAKKKTK